MDVSISRISTKGNREWIVIELNDGQMLPDFIDQALDNKDIEIFGDENLRSSHKIIKNEYNILFAKFVSANYSEWIQGKKNFLMSHDLLKKIIVR